MSQLNVELEQFENLIMCHLLDALYNDEIGKDNKEFRDFIETIKTRGLKPILLQKFMSMDQNDRMDYRRIKGVFTGKQKTSTIIVKYSEKEQEDQPAKILPKIMKAAVAGLAIKKSMFKKPNEDV